MLKLNVNEEKQLNFEIQIGGVQSDQVSSFLRIEIDNIEYGFPAQIGRETITVNMPALRSITSRKLQEGEEVAVKLEMVADGQYLTPWSDTFILSNPLVVEAKIIDDNFKNPPTFKTTLVQTGKTGDQKQGVVIEAVDETSIVDETKEEMTERIVNKLAEKLSPMIATKKETVTETKQTEETITEDIQEDIQEEVVEQPKSVVKKFDIKNIDEDGVYQYMKRAGTSNPTVQKLIYEQAEVAANSSKPVDVLRQVVKLLKSKN